ncbi:MAG: penicillin-binding protein, partial [Actinobacteria bacterium]|nr:penicillin-binding protein [Actinomycetota bacterium]
MSNRDLPGSYWQDDDAARYGSGRRVRSGGAQRDQRGYGRGYRDNGYNGRAAGNGARGRGQTWSGTMSSRARGSRSQSQPGYDGGQDFTGRFSQTAGDLRDWFGRQTSSWRRGGAAGAGAGAAYGYDRGRGTTRLAGSRTGLQFRNGGGGSGWGGGGGRWGGRPPGNLGDRFQDWLQSGSWWKHWTLRKVIALAGASVAGVILLGIGVFFYLYASTSVPTSHDLAANVNSSTVYWADGKTVMGHFDARLANGQSYERTLLSANQIPSTMTQAMTAAEDRHFYTEGGVSVSALMRAAYDDLLGHGNLQGGSTITMQYAKNYFNGVNTGQNLSTKLKEIIIAMKLGHSKSKQWVMTNYLNLVPFGPPEDTGLGAAANNYFRVNLQNGDKLTVAEAAMLAALPNSPGFLTPYDTKSAGYTALVARWHYVLSNMVRDGSITQAEADKQTFPALCGARPVPGCVYQPLGNGIKGYTGYLMNMVEQQLEAPKSVGGYGLTKRQVETGGYRITTTFRSAMVDQLASAVRAKRQQAGMPLYDRVGAVLENPKDGSILAVYGGPGFNDPHCAATACQVNYAEAAEQVGSSFKPYVLASAVNQGMDVSPGTTQLNGNSPLWIPNSATNGTTIPQIAMMPSLANPPQGVQANNPDGGYSNGVHYFKFNGSGQNRPLDVNVAAAISSDPAFEDLAHRDQIDNVIRMAAAFGVGQTAFVMPCSNPKSLGANVTQAQIISLCNDLTGPGFNLASLKTDTNPTGAATGNGMEENFGVGSQFKNSVAAGLNGTPGAPNIALGQSPLTPVEQASTFATLADGGVYHSPHVIAKGGLSLNGHVLADNIVTRQVFGDAKYGSTLQGNQTASDAATNVAWALSFDNVMQGATAVANVGNFCPRGVIGKTGTLGEGQTSSQAWFIGAMPNQAALSVGLFTDKPHEQFLNSLPSLNGMPGSQGGGWPAGMWDQFMTNSKWSGQCGTVQGPVHNSQFQTWKQDTQSKRCSAQQFFQQQFGGGGDQQNCTCPRAFRNLCRNQPSAGVTTGPGGIPVPITNNNPIPTPSTCVGRQCNNLPPTPAPTPSASTAALILGPPSS